MNQMEEELHDLRQRVRQLESKRIGCMDCGRAYGGPGWCEVLIPNWAWNLILGCGEFTEYGMHGILCFSCMARRLENHGLQDVPVRIESGPFARVTHAPGWLKQPREGTKF